MVCFALDWNPQISYILLLLIQLACRGLFCIRLKSPEQLHLVASYSSGVLWFALHQVEIPITVTFCCFVFKWLVVVCFALHWKSQISYILLLLNQVACCGLSCIRLKSPEQLHFVASYSSAVLCFFCIRLKSPEQLHFVASYSSSVLWFVLY